ncbi:hypothetical protein COCNU_scaffold000304G000010 [Cocos nucifera]|nr:hypothetical protein [Cocos nucifera]
MLTKGLYTMKRKGKAPSDGLKRANVGASSFEVPDPTATASEVITSTETTLTTEVDITGSGSVPSMPSGPSSKDRTLELPTKEGTREGRKKKKAIAKTSHKAHLGNPDGNSDERGEDPFDIPEIIQDLTNKFFMPEVVEQMANLDPR